MVYKLVAWILMGLSKMFNLCSELRHHSYRLLISALSELSFLSHCEPVHNTSETGFSFYSSIRAAEHCSGGASRSRRWIGAKILLETADPESGKWFLGGPGVLVHWGHGVNKPEGCGLSFVPFISSHIFPHLSSPVACPRDEPPSTVTSGAIACSTHGSTVVHWLQSQNLSSVSFHQHCYPWG